MPCSAANARTAAALPARHSSGPPGRPVQMPSSISTGETSTCSTPMRAGGRLDLEAGRRRGQDDGVPGLQVRRHQPPRLRVERAGDALDEQPLAELDELVLAAPGPGAHAEHGELLEVLLGRDPAQADEQQLAPGRPGSRAASAGGGGRTRPASSRR